jgi:hypothetical protein
MKNILYNNKYLKTTKKNLIYDDEYVKIFWIGIMDGNGEIQVNHWQKKNLQYKLTIKLKNIKSNYIMLIKITKIIGGNIRITDNKKDIIWIMNKKNAISKIISIFDVYPPLTSRLICQLNFLRVCLMNNSTENYLKIRNYKYNNQLNILEKNNKEYTMPYYFPYWLSGFIEAKGSFGIKINNDHSFFIGQNDDYYILGAIKSLFNIKTKIKNFNNNFYSIKIHKKKIVYKIIKHCIKFPLLGEKSKSLNTFIKVNILNNKQ